MESLKKVDIPFPDQYVHFGNLDKHIDGLKATREITPYSKTYEDCWTLMCMVLDKNLQSRSIQSLRTNLQGSQGHDYELQAQNYWDKMAHESAYSIFKRYQEELRQSGSVAKNVNAWKITNKDSGRLIDFRDEFKQAALEKFPYLNNRELMRKAFGGEHNMPTYGYTRGLYEQLINHGGKKYLSYVSLLILLNAARTLSYGNLIDRIHQDRTIKITVDDQEVFIRTFLQKSEAYHYLAFLLDKAVLQEEESLFGDNDNQACVLWRSLVFLRTSVLDTASSKNKAKIIRENLMQYLIDQDYSRAKYCLEELAAKYPGIVSSLAIEDLDIDPNTLRQLYVEQEQLARNGEENKKRKIDIDSLLDRDLVSEDGEIRIRIYKSEKGESRIYIVYTKSDGSFGNKIRTTVDYVLSVIETFGLKPTND